MRWYRGSSRLTLIAMCFAQGMIVLDLTIVNVALPSIQHDLHVSAGGLEWVVSAYALALATLILIGGAIGDRYGRKRFFLIGLLVFTAASVGCALSTSAPELVVFRMVEGIGGAFMSSLTLSILVETFPPETRAGAIGTWAAVAGLGFGLGPVIGGVLLGVFDWSSIFWVNVPLGLGAMAVTVVGVADSRDASPRRLDLVGAGIAAAGLFALTFGLTESLTWGWGSSTVRGLCALGVLLLIAFAWWEGRATSPMVPPALVRQRVFASTNSVYFLAYLAQVGMFFFVTLLYQNVLGWSALRTGLSWLPMNIPFLIVAQFAGRLASRFRPVTIIVAGCLIGGAGVLGLGMVRVGTPYWYVALCYVVFGLGYGTFVPACSTAAMSRVPQGASGVASGVLNTSRQIGSSVGLAVLGSIGVTVVARSWRTQSAHLHGVTAAAAGHVASEVSVGQIHAVRSQLGPAAAHVASSSFVSGYQVGLIAAGLGVILAALIAAIGLRTPRSGREQRADEQSGTLATSGSTDDQRVSLPSPEG